MPTEPAKDYQLLYDTDRKVFTMPNICLAWATAIRVPVCGQRLCPVSYGFADDKEMLLKFMGSGGKLSANSPDGSAISASCENISELVAAGNVYVSHDSNFVPDEIHVIMPDGSTEELTQYLMRTIPGV